MRSAATAATNCSRGYGHYDRLLWMKGNLGRVPREMRVPIAKAAEAILPIGFKGRNWLQGLGEDLDSGLPLIGSYFDAATRRRLLSNGLSAGTVAEAIRSERIPATADLLETRHAAWISRTTSPKTSS